MRAAWSRACAVLLLLWLPAAAAAGDRESCGIEPGDAAIAACSRAIASGTLSVRNLAVMYDIRGLAYFAKGDADRAIADYDEAIRLAPHGASALANRGVVWSSKGDDDRAIADFDQAIQINPQYAPAYLHRGAAWIHKGDADRATADAEQAIRLDPDHAGALYGRGLAKRQKGDGAGAAADIASARRIKPDIARELARSGAK